MTNRIIQVSVPETYFVILSRIAELRGHTLSGVSCQYLSQSLALNAQKEIELLERFGT